SDLVGHPRGLVNNIQRLASTAARLIAGLAGYTRAGFGEGNTEVVVCSVPIVSTLELGRQVLHEGTELKEQGVRIAGAVEFHLGCAGNTCSKVARKDTKRREQCH